MAQVGVDEVSLVGEAGLCHHTARGGVGGEREGDEVAKADLVERDIDACDGDLGRKALAPVVGPEATNTFT